MKLINTDTSAGGTATYNYRTADGRKVCAWCNDANLGWTFMVFAPYSPTEYACVGEFTARGVDHAGLMPIIEAALIVLMDGYVVA